MLVVGSVNKNCSVDFLQSKDIFIQSIWQMSQKHDFYVIKSTNNSKNRHFVSLITGGTQYDK